METPRTSLKLHRTGLVGVEVYDKGALSLAGRDTGMFADPATLSTRRLSVGVCRGILEPTLCIGLCQLYRKYRRPRALFNAARLVAAVTPGVTFPLVFM